MRLPPARSVAAPVGLALLTAGALALRLWNAGAGLPHFPQSDEPGVLGMAVRFGTGDLNPHWFTYPTLWLYVLFAAFGAYFVAGRAVGLFGSLADFQARYFVDPSALYVIGRGLSALLGAATIPLVYALGARLAGRPAGFVAATLVAVAPLHVQYSHYLVTDVPLTFAVALAMLLLLRLAAGERPAGAWLPALAVGLTTSVKYPAGLLLLPLGAALVLRAPPPRAVPRVAVALAAAGGWVLAGFLLGTPYALLDLPALVRGVGEKLDYAVSGHLGFDPAERGFMRYLLRDLPEGAGPLVTALGLAGFVWMTVRAVLRREAGPLLVAAFALPTFLAFAASRVPWARYLLPLLPFLAIGAAFALWRLTAPLPTRWRAAARAVLVVVALAGPCALSVGWVASLARPDTRTEARAWVERHIPAGSTLALEWYGPPLTRSLDQLAGEIEALRRVAPGDADARRQLERSTLKHATLGRLPADAPAYTLYRLNPDPPRSTESDTLPYDVAALRARGVRWVVLSSYMWERFQRHPWLHPAQVSFYAAIAGTGRLRLELSPLEPACRGSREPLADARALDRRCARLNGPALRVFELPSR